MSCHLIMYHFLVNSMLGSSYVLLLLTQTAKQSSKSVSSSIPYRLLLLLCLRYGDFKQLLVNNQKLQSSASRSTKDYRM